MQHITILSPLYQDEASFNIFAAAVEKIAENLKTYQFSFLVVNDGTDALSIQSKLPLTILHLHRNIGHQKAIAIGLAYAQQTLSFDRILVMDVDGEDRPEDIPRLLQAEGSEERITVAGRASRQEGRSFRSFYVVYKFLFYLLTGKKINFGNFMAIPRKEAAKLVHHSELWNHLAGAIVKSRLPYLSVPTHRGRRYAGKSQMNFTALLLHGLGAIGVFVEIIATRLLLFSFFMILLAVLAILIIVYIRYFTDKAIPGWATNTITSMLIVILQSFLLSLFTVFLYVSSGSQRKFIPANHYRDLLRTVETHGHAS